MTEDADVRFNRWFEQECANGNIERMPLKSACRHAYEFGKQHYEREVQEEAYKMLAVELKAFRSWIEFKLDQRIKDIEE